MKFICLLLDWHLMVRLSQWCNLIMEKCLSVGKMKFLVFDVRLTFNGLFVSGV